MYCCLPWSRTKTDPRAFVVTPNLKLPEVHWVIRSCSCEFRVIVADSSMKCVRPLGLASFASCVHCLAFYVGFHRNIGSALSELYQHIESQILTIDVIRNRIQTNFQPTR